MFRASPSRRLLCAAERPNVGNMVLSKTRQLHTCHDLCLRVSNDHLQLATDTCMIIGNQDTKVRLNVNSALRMLPCACCKANKRAVLESCEKKQAELHLYGQHAGCPCKTNALRAKQDVSCICTSSKCIKDCLLYTRTKLQHRKLCLVNLRQLSDTAPQLSKRAEAVDVALPQEYAGLLCLARSNCPTQTHPKQPRNCMCTHPHRTPNVHSFLQAMHIYQPR